MGSVNEPRIAKESPHWLGSRLERDIGRYSTPVLKCYNIT